VNAVQVELVCMVNDFRGSSSKLSFYTALLIAFIDFMGVGLVFPILSPLLFASPLLASSTSHEVRGLWLGILLAVHPFAQFFGSPIWGVLSDHKGRKSVLQISLCVALVGYILFYASIFLFSLSVLLIARMIVGFAAGNMSVVSAAIADLSTPEQKPRHFSLYSMALGIGTAVGPLIGAAVIAWGYSLPFLVATVLVLVNLFLVFLFFRETNLHPQQKKISWNLGVAQLKKAFSLHGELRMLLLCAFLVVFAWTHYNFFLPVFLISHVHFDVVQINLFVGIQSATYALTTGILNRPLLNRIQPIPLLFISLFFVCLGIASLFIIPSSRWLWPQAIYLGYSTGFFFPLITTIVSNSVSSEIQGEILGILSGIYAAAMVCSTLFLGPFVGIHPRLPIWIGTITLLLITCIGLVYFRKEITQWSKK
jgi:MFS transporter, DHA1 family, tetracycline resistance protein